MLGAVFLLHGHVVPATDPDAGQMIAFRDLLCRTRTGATENGTKRAGRIAHGRCVCVAHPGIVVGIGDAVHR